VLLPRLLRELQLMQYADYWRSSYADLLRLLLVVPTIRLLRPELELMQYADYQQQPADHSLLLLLLLLFCCCPDCCA
jgi:hypothetical protein